MADDGDEEEHDLDGVEDGYFEDGFEGEDAAELVALDSDSPSFDSDSGGTFLVVCAYRMNIL